MVSNKLIRKEYKEEHSAVWNPAEKNQEKKTILGVKDRTVKKDCWQQKEAVNWQSDLWDVVEGGQQTMIHEVKAADICFCK